MLRPSGCRVFLRGSPSFLGQRRRDRYRWLWAGTSPLVTSTQRGMHHFGEAAMVIATTTRSTPATGGCKDQVTPDHQRWCRRAGQHGQP